MLAGDDDGGPSILHLRCRDSRAVAHGVLDAGRPLLRNRRSARRPGTALRMRGWRGVSRPEILRDLLRRWRLGQRVPAASPASDVLGAGLLHGPVPGSDAQGRKPMRDGADLLRVDVLVRREGLGHLQRDDVGGDRQPLRMFRHRTAHGRNTVLRSRRSLHRLQYSCAPGRDLSASGPQDRLLYGRAMDGSDRVSGLPLSFGRARSQRSV